YPQFATHNAHTVSAILDMADDLDSFEFQRLHGMGEALHDIVLSKNKTRCRIYAPVGAHRDLLAYLVRRLLENGANSSFVNQIVDENVPPEVVAKDPFETLEDDKRSLTKGPDLFQPERPNSKGFDLRDRPTLEALESARAPYREKTWQAEPLLAEPANPEPAKEVENPFQPSDSPGTVAHASAQDIETALSCANPWRVPAAERARILNAAADLYEANHGELFAILAREAGKMPLDVIAELREAVDFLRYYAANISEAPPAGIFTCISPWNFPLAIFTGQISAALAAGNGVLAKPADQTPLIAFEAVKLLHEAGVPRDVLQLLPGSGASVGTALTSDPRINGVAFTGSTATALRIRSAMAENLAPGTPLIAETGGLNAMIVDSTALPEQAVTAIVESAFQSAGQRCSALRCLYVQDDIAADLLKMLEGAMLELSLGDPWDDSTDCGPVIDQQAFDVISEHINTAQSEDRVLYQLVRPANGHFIPPTMIRIDSIQDLKKEIFGPVLHVATFKSNELDKVISDINATGYGLTFGLQTRIDDRVQHVCDSIHAGNIYVNRNQIGAIVGSQPFGGEGLSGTGPKAGGPFYLTRFANRESINVSELWDTEADAKTLADLLAKSGKDNSPEALSSVTVSLPGPTGESNRLTSFARSPVLCLGPGPDAARKQADAVRALGGIAVEAQGQVSDAQLETLSGFSSVLWWGSDVQAKAYERVLAKREGAIIPLVCAMPDAPLVRGERHVCVDTTAAGGNAALLGGAA
ncbi:MAG: bifunctional proline dehydrogenase/L-glutamate gamma-semialdehyde dehydrogenase PutA, partial [Rhodobacteraceae bacterium]|nr:bifunctional proline dehydrogenase/L-glutamate gamma-semialdehyde dehydrogenase PutA [Paracoccaceae bacterium]